MYIYSVINTIYNAWLFHEHEGLIVFCKMVFTNLMGMTFIMQYNEVLYQAIKLARDGALVVLSLL